MKRILFASAVLLMLLTACSAPVRQVPPSTELSGNYTYGIYELDFSVERLSGWPFGDWDFIYTYNNEVIESGHQVLLPVGIFTFYSVRVDVIERDDPGNSYGATFPVAICNGGSGKTEITVTAGNGKTAIFRIFCNVVRTGEQ